MVGLFVLVLAGCSTFEDIFGGGDEDDETAVDISLTSPTNGAENQETSLTLTWSGNGTTYDVYLDKVNPPTTKVKNDNSTTSYDISALDGGTKYYWQVEATKDGTSEKSGVWSFTTERETGGDGTGGTSGGGSGTGGGTTIKKKSIKGSVQKGPFINGTDISINELDSNLAQTGKFFSTQISDNKGTFEVKNVELASKYVSLKANGFYFNETKNSKSNSQITLYALSDISDKTTINVNLLSTLEKPRIEYLVGTGVSFSEAKRQAKTEVLKIFNLDTINAGASETLDISKSGDGNAALLAMSLILQGFRKEAEMTELISNISTDIKKDGILHSSSLGSQLINHAPYLFGPSIRNNLVNRYKQLGISVTIPNYEKHIKVFTENSSFSITKPLIEYPTKDEAGNSFNNLFDPKSFVYSSNGSKYAVFLIFAKMSEYASLTIKITSKVSNPGIWGERPYGLSGTIPLYGGYPELEQSVGWVKIKSDSEPNSSPTLTIKAEQGISGNHSGTIGLTTEKDGSPGEYLIEYFEMDTTEPTRTKTIKVE